MGMHILRFMILSLALAVFSWAMRTQALSRDQAWVVGTVPSSFPKLVPFSGDPAEPEIIGGVPSKWADLVALRIPGHEPPKEYLCSGVLLRGDAILTAAHCLCPEGRSITKAPFVASAVAEDLTKLNAWREAADFEFFPGWSCSAMGRVSDLAVVFLVPRPNRALARPLERVNGANRARPFKKCRIGVNASSWSDRILYLSDVLRRPPSTQFGVAGFGLDGSGDKGVPLEVKVSITSLICTSRKAQLRWCKPFREMILGADSRDRGVRDSCGGDSGGPVYWEAPDGTRFLVGTVSRGVPPLLGERPLGCGLGGIYTHVGLPEVQAWLQTIGVGPESICG